MESFICLHYRVEYFTGFNTSNFFAPSLGSSFYATSRATSACQKIMWGCLPFIIANCTFNSNRFMIPFIFSSYYYIGKTFAIQL